MIQTPPQTYASLGFKEIAISNVPESSPSVTKVVIVAFNRPNKYNAFTGSMVEELETAFTLLGVDPRVKAIVLTGNGKAFCAGADLEAGFSGLLAHKKDEKSIKAYRDGGGRVALAITRCPKPTIAAVNGPAAGVGFTLMLPATIRVAWSGAKLAIPFSRRGVTLESCSAFYLPRLIGLSKAMHISTTGATYLASDSLVRDLFSQIFQTPEETVQYALQLAADIAENTSGVSTKLNRDLLLYAPDTPDTAHLLESEAFLYMVGSDDNVEGVSSFMEKRRAQFKGELNTRDFPFWPWWGEGKAKGDAKL
ncbi:related to enoyl-CoA hydratase/carnithine racemase [Cephalotrichum gorgonifer]|uniref:Related to enoyl-CoA hydratase/carnithine racemase n=1 Tax=Cephalotrichum gorgonifer TaxID=2041049 RepID=A0AAE8SXF0_9PEZI|nr:related to enoyl-CoA hydratase/carnithine racemase [Cephalotrichum gorgonifer]